MSEMVERVARAIETYGVAYSHVTLADMSTACRRWRVHKITDHAPTDDDVVSVHEDKASAYLECRALNARAVLAALREPTDEMIEAGSDKWDECYHGNRDGSLDLSTEQTAEEIFRAMVAAAIQSQPTP